MFSYHSDNLTKCQKTQLKLIGVIPVNSKYSHCHCVDNVLTQSREAKCCVDKMLCWIKVCVPNLNFIG